MQLQIKFKRMKIADLFDFPETNSKITKKICNQYPGKIPVYASSKDKNPTLGFIEDNLKNVKYYENCLSWNRNGSVGYVFIRNNRFATNEDHRALIIKKEYKDKLNKLYLKFEIERQLFMNGFSFLNKCGVEKIKLIEILIPLNGTGEFDIDRQKRFGNQYKEIQKMKEELNYFFKEFNKIKVYFSNMGNLKSIPLTQILDMEKGNAKYTKRYIHNHQGKFPVYSSQTTNLGNLGNIDTYDYDEECFTWTTDGIHAGTIFYRNGKFSITTHCGILRVKGEYKDKINYEYLNFILDRTLPSNTLGEWANKRLGIERMKEILIELPQNKDGEFDLDKQKEMARKYMKIKQIKEKLQENYEMLMDSKVQVIKEDFK